MSWILYSTFLDEDGSHLFKMLLLCTNIAVIIFMRHSLSSTVNTDECVASGDFKTATSDQTRSMPLNDIFQYLYWTNSSSCSIRQGFGGRLVRSDNYIGYFARQEEVCMDKSVAPSPTEGCLVYSIGLPSREVNDWSLEEAFVQFGCQVFAFDPQHLPLANASKVHFIQLGLSNSDTDRGNGFKNWKLRTLASLYRMLAARQHGAVPIDYLKLSIDKSEWIVIPQLIDSGVLDNVRQLSVRINFYVNIRYLEYFQLCVKVIKSLEEYGMVRFFSRVAPHTDSFVMKSQYEYLSYDITWYNRRFHSAN